MSRRTKGPLDADTVISLFRAIWEEGIPPDVLARDRKLATRLVMRVAEGQDYEGVIRCEQGGLMGYWVSECREGADRYYLPRLVKDRREQLFW